MSDGQNKDCATDENQDLVNKLLDGSTWAEFCDAFKMAGDQILRPEAPTDELTQAEGYRYLTRLMRIALDMFMECGDRDFPAFYRPSHETAKIGADNPDNYYQRAELNGNCDYKISGRRGTVHYLSFGTQAGGYGEDGRNEPTGFLDASHIELEADGSFEIMLSKTKQAGNWLPMTADTKTVIVRQTFLNRNEENIADLKIERINADATPKPLDAASVTLALKSSAAFVNGTARLFADWSAGYKKEGANKLIAVDQKVCQSVGGDPNIYYLHGYWALAEDEVLVIDVDQIPECDMWNYQLDNYWMESLDYRYHPITLNNHTAHYRDDGSARLVVAHEDPGVANWIDTAGHRVGTHCFRWIGAQEYPLPQVSVKKLTDLKSD